ncbi:hypothetical protein HBI21_085650 [Parastagonospora nodorum]|nr:hypothetical protein HBI21_085650 [Parastagonospora nodorum]
MILRILPLNRKPEECGDGLVEVLSLVEAIYYSCHGVLEDRMLCKKELSWRHKSLQLLISFSSSDSVTITSRQSSAGSLRTVASSSELHAAGCRLCVYG